MAFIKLMPEQSLSFCRRNLFAFLSLSFLVLMIYSNNFHASWQFDDEPNIVYGDALHLKKLGWNEIKETFFWGKRIYRPVSCLSLALNYYFGRLNVFGYHLINNLIHVISAIFLFLFIHHTLNLPNLRNSYAKHSYSIALLATVFWASNPVQTQAVTYIVQRMTSMAGMFYIMAMYFYVKARINRFKSPRILFLILCILAMAFAFGSKENTIVLPVTLLIYEILIIKGKSFKDWISKNWKICIIFILALSAMVLIYLYFVQGGGKPLFFLGRYDSRSFGLQERLLTEPRIIIFYITLLLYPVPSRLCLNHDIILSQTLFKPIDTLFAILFIALLLIGAVITSKRWPLLAFCVIFFFLNHLVESTIIPLELIYEHRNYIPSMLFFVPVSILLLKASSYYSNKKVMHTIVIIFIVFLLTAQGHSTYIRNFTWKTQESLWLDCVDKYPDSWRPHHNLARVYEKKNKYNAAISEYLLAIPAGKGSPNQNEEAMSYNNLGVIYQKLKFKEKALYYYQQAEKTSKKFASIYLNKGNLFLAEGLPEKAISEYGKAIQYDKRNSGAYANLGYALLIKGDTDQAIENFERAQKLGLNDFKLFRLLGYAYRKKKAYGKAYLMLKRAQALKPQDPLTLLYLTELYAFREMTKRKNETMNSFFQSFHDDRQGLKIFLGEIARPGKLQEPILPDRKMLLTLFSAECHLRGQAYQELADFLSSSK